MILTHCENTDSISNNQASFPFLYLEKMRRVDESLTPAFDLIYFNIGYCFFFYSARILDVFIGA